LPAGPLPQGRLFAFPEKIFQTARWGRKHAETLHVLFVGNSYTFCNDLPLLVRELSEHEAKPIEVDVVALSNLTLQLHWEMGAALQKIKDGHFDIVVLQEFSTGPLTDKERFFKYARLFDEQIKLNGAKTLFYLTWARQNTPQMQTLLTDAYTAIAQELGAGVVPAGPAWQMVLKNNPDISLYIYDGSHPTIAGSYLTACVFYEKLYGKSALGLPASIQIKDGPRYEVDAKVAEALQRAADSAAGNVYGK